MSKQLLSGTTLRTQLRKFSVPWMIMLSALLLSPFLSEKLQAQTYNGNITLTTQAAVNAFNYSEITGDLTINSGNSITDLSPLSKLIKVGTLSIYANTSLTSLTGLDNLTSMGYLNIGNNSSLKSLGGLTHLASVRGDFGLSNNISLTSLDGLENLTSVGGYFTISINNSLTSLTGLDNLSSSAVLDINNNNSLTSLTGLNNFTRGAALNINFNNSLISLAGLDHLGPAFAGSLGISGNNSLTSLAALSYLTSIGGGLTLFNNNSLASLAGLDHITSVGGEVLGLSRDLTISSNNVLTSLSGLDHLTTVGGNLSIQRNSRLSACCILPSITANVKGSVTIADNAPGCNNIADISAVCTVPATLSVFYTDGSSQQTTGNILRPYLQINNESTSSLAYQNIIVRYWLTVEDFSSLNTSISWAQLGTSLVSARYVPLPQPRSGAFGYIEYAFAAGAGSLASMNNSGPILSQVSKADWTNFNQADDYSYAAPGSYSKNSHITAYYNGALVWGTEPAPVTRLQNLKTYAASRDNAATTGSIGTTVQVNNEGNAAVGYQDITVRYWFTADGSQPLLYQLDYAKMGQLGVKSRFATLPNALPAADTYLELGFTAADSLYPLSSTGNLLQRIRKSDWSGFDQLNDHSFLSGTSLAENQKITVYVKGSLVYGVEPTATGVMSFSSMQKTNSAVAAEGANPALHVTVLGNPVSGNTIEMMISGAHGKRIMVTVTDALGRVVSERQVMQPVAGQRISMPVEHAATQLLYIRVNTDREVKTVGVLRAR